MERVSRVLIIEDHPMFREGLKAILGTSPAYEVAGEAGTVREGLEMAGRLAPDLVLLDISLPDDNGLRCLSALRLLEKAPRAVVVSMHGNVDHIVEAFQAGAIAYVTKDSAGEQLIQALDAAVRGEYYLDGSASHDVLRKLRDVSHGKIRYADPEYEALTDREQQVLRLLAEGRSSKDIGERLFISHKTVENHRSRLMRKLGLQSAVDIVRYAAKMGLIDIDRW